MGDGALPQTSDETSDDRPVLSFLRFLMFSVNAVANAWKLMSRFLLPKAPAPRQPAAEHRVIANKRIHSQHLGHPGAASVKSYRLSSCDSTSSRPVASSRRTPKNTGKSTRIRPIAIVEDDPNDQLLLKRLINQSHEFVCVGCFASGESAVAGIPRCGAKLVLMDLRLPGMSGLETARRLRKIAPRLKIIAITGFASEANLNEALDREFSGFLTKPVSRRDLMDALKVASDGGIYLSPDLRQFFHGAHRAAPAHPATRLLFILTPREREVIALPADGLEYKEIAERLKIKPSTVNNHLANVREKLGVHNAIEAINKLFPRPE